jgi:hypothetical protein
MAYIGSYPADKTSGSKPRNEFTGDGTTVNFTLSQEVPGGFESNVLVIVDNVIQQPVESYTIGGNNITLTFSEAPASGAVIYVLHQGTATYNMIPVVGSVTPDKLSENLRNFTVDTFTGNGSTTAYTLTAEPASANSILVIVDGIVQTRTSNYTLAGTTLTFTDAPDNTAAITVIHLGFSTVSRTAVPDGSITTSKIADGAITSDKIATGGIATEDIADSAITSAKIANGTIALADLSATGTKDATTFLRGDNTFAVVAVTPTAVSDQNNTSTGYLDLPSGTTAQRPGSPVAGMVRYNTTNNEYEVYQNSSWLALSTQTVGLYSANYLVVAGGGGSGAGAGGGGGAGGLLTGSQTLLTGTVYTVTVGAGGVAGNNVNGGNGENSVFGSITAIGGGGGAMGSGSAGANGGSGGGAGANSGQAGGSGTTGQGNPGGSAPNGSAPYPSAGGGGAGAAGDNGSGSQSGAGGVGLASSITGTSVFYAGGGGGAGTVQGAANGAGGNGGGGAGGNPAIAGTANTGGGAGGQVNNGYTLGTSGGSGVVILSVPTTKYSGITTGSPTITTSGSNTVIKFTQSGSYTA